MRFLKIPLPATVFITGACVLVIEIVATRILAPYFGNTIFTVSSVISVVLAALSIGYYVGGKLADRTPSPKLFYGIVLFGGVSVLILYWLQVLFLPTLGRTLSLSFGPLVTSTLLFFLPSVVLGMLSPFAIKLQQQLHKKQGIGSIAGEMFFWSTMGSIAGSLLAGYALIPHFGIRAIVIGVALVLIVLGGVPLLALGLDKKLAAKLGIIIAPLVLLSATASPITQGVYARDGVYERITVTEGNYNGRPARFLFQDRSASGAAFIGSDDLVYEYTKYYALYKTMMAEKPKRVLVIGGGAFSMPKAYMKALPQAEVDVSEIETGLVDLSKKYFGLSDNPRLHHFSEDGRRLLQDAPKPYDVIFSDVYYSLYSIPSHFTTKEFFQTAYDKLNKDGIFIANIIGSLDTSTPSIVWSEIKTMQQVFPQVYAFAVRSADVQESQNIILVGQKSSERLRFDAVPPGSGRIFIPGLAEHEVHIKQSGLKAHQIVTDNFAPVESWTANLLRTH